MNSLSGAFFLAAYIVAVGVGSFLQKFVMNKVTPFQLDVMTALGLLVISVPALFLAQKNLTLPFLSAPLAWVVGILFALGSFVYVLAVARLPVSIAAPVSAGYIVLAVLLSTLFLKEPMGLMKGVGIALTVVGVALLSI